jgi:outer membrane protein assembly factor BamA
VKAAPQYQALSRPYRFRVSPDILLFLAGYDSSYGFVGGGMMSLSDYLGNHRLSVMGNSIPKAQTGYQASYEFARYRATFNVGAYYYKDYFSLYDLRTGNLVDQYRDDERGLNVQCTYPLSPSTRFEYGIGTQRFSGRATYLRFSEGISNHFFAESDGEDRANYYKVSLVREKRRGYRFWPASGYGCSLTYLQAPILLDSNVNFRNVLAECEWYVDLKPLQHLVWANRLVGFHSEGPDPQTFFLGPDRPFQSFFTTLRGFGSSEYFGQNLVLYNVELRYPMATSLNFPLRPFSFILVKDIELAAFSDTGAVAERTGDFKSGSLLNSAGVGLRFYNFVFQRALVQLRFDVAWRTDAGQHDPTFHFNLAPMF